MTEHKDTVIHLENQGSIHISEDVVAAIAALAASEVEGVSMLSVSGTGIDLLGKKNLSKGIKIALNDKNVNVDVYVAIAYGKAIPQTARQIQQKIREAIESMTGLTIGGINVHVGGVSFGKPKEAKK